MFSSGSLTGSRESAAEGHPKSSDQYARIAILLLLWAVLHTLATLKLPTSGEAIDLRGPDSFMRLVRVAELYADGGWFDSLVERDNAPYGYALHWTRPLDLLLLAIALPLTVLFDFDTALFWAGMAVSPLLHLALVFVLLWALLPLVHRDRAFVAALLLLGQPLVLGFSVSGYADHHTFLLLSFVITLGFGLRAATNPGAGTASLATGLAAGFGIWLSTELLIVPAIAAVSLGSAWLAEGRPRTSCNLRFAISFLAMICLALLVERGLEGFVRLEYDRISLAHIGIALLLAAFWGAVWLMERAKTEAQGGWRPRLAIACLGGAAILGGAYLALPGLFAGPLAAMDPRVEPIWHEIVAEMEPLWPNSRERLVSATTFIGLAVFCLPFAMYYLVERRRDQRRWGLLMVAMGAAVLTVASLAHMRLAGYAEILYVMIFGLFLERLAVWRQQLGSPLLGAAAQVFVIATAIAGPVGLAIGLKSQSGVEVVQNDGRGRCTVAPLAPVLNDRSTWVGAEPRTVLTMIDNGPELLYRTPHRVIGSPYHRNPDGILDSYNALASSDDEAIRAILAARSVDVILLCFDAAEKNFFQDSGAGNSLYGRLARDEVPDWLAPIPTPGVQFAHFRLYRVVPAR